MTADRSTGGGGAAVLTFIREHQLPIGVIVVTVAYEREREQIEALGPDGIFAKPIDPAEVLAALKACANTSPPE